LGHTSLICTSPLCSINGFVQEEQVSGSPGNKDVGARAHANSHTIRIPASENWIRARNTVISLRLKWRASVQRKQPPAENLQKRVRARERCKYNAWSTLGAGRSRTEYWVPEQQAASALGYKTSWASACVAYVKGASHNFWSQHPREWTGKITRVLLFLMQRHFPQHIRQQLQNPSRQLFLHDTRLPCALRRKALIVIEETMIILKKRC
jgi:hypothetical protein